MGPLSLWLHVAVLHSAALLVFAQLTSHVAGHNSFSNRDIDRFIANHDPVGSFKLCLQLRKRLEAMRFGQSFLTQMRDSLQLYQYYLRRVLDYEKLIKEKRTPSETEEERAGYATETSLQELQKQHEDFVDKMNNANSTYLQCIDFFERTIPPAMRSDMGFLPRCMIGALNTELYPERGANAPTISFLLQYFRQPDKIKRTVEPLHACVKKLGVAAELLVNVDSPSDAGLWAEWVEQTDGFVIPILSNNVHEIRGYNRLARLASGRILTAIQVCARGSTVRAQC